MSRTRGYRVKLWQQGIEGGKDAPEYIREGSEPKLFPTESLAQEMGEEYTRDKPELTFALEPVTT